jgi:hypothetical protein
MRIVAAIAGDLRQIIEQQQDGVADAMRQGVVRASTRLQADLRSQVRAAGLGAGLEKAWRLQLYPTGKRTIHPAGLVFSKSTVLHGVFAEGATIAAKGGRWLVIPMPAAEKMGLATTDTSRKGGAVPGGALRRASQYGEAMERLGEHNMRVATLSGGRKLVLYRPGNQRRGKARGEEVPLFLLVPQVRLTPRLTMAAAERDAAATLNAEIAAALSGVK